MTFLVSDNNPFQDHASLSPPQYKIEGICSRSDIDVPPLIPKSDKHLISPNNITPKSNTKVMMMNDGN